MDSQLQDHRGSPLPNFSMPECVVAARDLEVPETGVPRDRAVSMSDKAEPGMLLADTLIPGSFIAPAFP